MERLTQRENNRLIMVKQDNGEYIPAYWDEDNFKAIKNIDKIGESLFLTHKEAEKKLDEMKKEERAINCSDYVKEENII